MRRANWALMLALGIAASLALAACGGDDGGGSEDEDLVTEAVETASTGTDPGQCTTLYTQAFVEQTQFATGPEAIAGCEEDAADPASDSVEVSNVSVDGDTATAEAAYGPGQLDGQTLVLGLVKEGDTWKVDSRDEFVDFDQAAFAAGLGESVAESGDAPEEVVDCMTSAITDGDSEAIQAAYLSGDENELLALFGDCFGG